MADSTDDPVLRIVEAAVDAQTRLMLAYMEQMRQQVTDQVRRAMHTEMAGEQIYIGKGTASRQVERAAAIRKDCAPVAEGGAGMSIRAAARKYHLSKSQVFRIVVKNGTGDCSTEAGRGENE